MQWVWKYGSQFAYKNVFSKTRTRTFELNLRSHHLAEQQIRNDTQITSVTLSSDTCSLIEDDIFPYQETKFTDKNSGYTNLYSTLFWGNFHGNHAASVWNEHSYSTRTMHGLGNRLGLRLCREVHRVVRLAYAISCSVRSTNVQYMYSVMYSTVHVQVVHVLYAVVHMHWLYCGCAVLRRSRACACTHLCVMGDRSASVKS